METAQTLILFGKRVQTLRKQKGLKQEQLAEKADLSSWEQISKIERGVSSTNLKTIIAIANALNVPLADLFDFSLEDVKDRKKTEALKELMSFLLKHNAAYIRYIFEQAKVSSDHWKK